MKDGTFSFFFLYSHVIIGKTRFYAKSMEVSYFDRKFSSFTDYVVFQIINILSQCIVGNLLGSMKQWKQYRSLKIKILRLVKQQVYITVSYFLEFYYYRLVEEKNMVSKRPGHFPFLLKLFSSIFFCKGYTFPPKENKLRKTSFVTSLSM